MYLYRYQLIKLITTLILKVLTYRQYTLFDSDLKLFDIFSYITADAQYHFQCEPRNSEFEFEVVDTELSHPLTL